MDVSKLRRNASVILDSLMETPKNELISKTGCRILIPTRFAEHKLATISNEIRIVGVFVMVIGDNYGVSSAAAMMQITPTSTTIIDINGDEYYDFTFAPGAQITPNLELVVDDPIAYMLYDEIIAKGHIPWFFNYEDVGKLFVSAPYHANIVLGGNNVALEMIAASISRDSKDRTVYYRHTIKSIDEQHTRPPTFIAFRNVIYGATNTTAKLMGAYFDDGLLSSLVNPSETTEGVETLLRL